MFAVYEIETGRLVSTGSVVADDAILQARGYGKKDVADSDANNGTWNPATLAFDPRPAEKSSITPFEFKSRFTVQERIAIRASTDPVVLDFLDMLSSTQEVRTDLVETQAGVAYLAAAGLLAPERVAEIIA